MTRRPRDGYVLWLILGAIACMVAVFLLTRPASAARAQRHWGGSDFAISCQTVREWRSTVNRMSASRKSELARQFNITRKQRRQAYACLKGR